MHSRHSLTPRRAESDRPRTAPAARPGGGACAPVARPARRTRRHPAGCAHGRDLDGAAWARVKTQRDRERLERLRTVLDQGIELKRRVVEELRPTLLDTMGLLAALRWQSEETCKRANLRCTERYPDEEPRLNRAGAIALFRVVQEALANVAKHAKASNVDISFEMSNQEVILTVHDDGVGAATTAMTRPRSHGIAGMRHRINVLGGRLDVVIGAGSRHDGPGPGAAAERDPEQAGSDADDSGSFAAVPWAAGAGRRERQADRAAAISVRMPGSRS
jgi:hypothetical protein